MTITVTYADLSGLSTDAIGPYMAAFTTLDFSNESTIDGAQMAFVVPIVVGGAVEAHGATITGSKSEILQLLIGEAHVVLQTGVTDLSQIDSTLTPESRSLLSRACGKGEDTAFTPTLTDLQGLIVKGMAVYSLLANQLPLSRLYQNQASRGVAQLGTPVSLVGNAENVRFPLVGPIPGPGGGGGGGGALVSQEEKKSRTWLWVAAAGAVGLGAFLLARKPKADYDFYR